MPIVIEAVSLESYLLWLSSQNSPQVPFNGRIGIFPSTSPSALISKYPSLSYSFASRRNYSTNSAAGKQNSNLHNNPHLNQVCAKIVNLLSALTPTVLEYALDFLIKSQS